MVAAVVLIRPSIAEVDKESTVAVSSIPRRYRRRLSVHVPPMTVHCRRISMNLLVHLQVITASAYRPSLTEFGEFCV